MLPRAYPRDLPPRAYPRDLLPRARLRAIRAQCESERGARTGVTPNAARATLQARATSNAARTTLRACATSNAARTTLRACATCPTESHLSHFPSAETVPLNPGESRMKIRFAEVGRGTGSRREGHVQANARFRSSSLLIPCASSRTSVPHPVMPGLVPGISLGQIRRTTSKHVDGRDKPGGHDGVWEWPGRRDHLPAQFPGTNFGNTGYGCGPQGAAFSSSTSWVMTSGGAEIHSEVHELVVLEEPRPVGPAVGVVVELPDACTSRLMVPVSAMK